MGRRRPGSAWWLMALGLLIAFPSCVLGGRAGFIYLNSGLGEMGCDSDSCIDRVRSEARTDGLVALLGLLGTVAGFGLVVASARAGRPSASP